MSQQLIMQPSDTPRLSATPDSAASLPFVSVVMPIRNEAGYIEGALLSVLGQDYPPDRFEIIVADGMSDDGTPDILRRLQTEYQQLKVVENPGRIVAKGVNLAIRNSQGEIVIWLSGHVEIKTDFLQQSVALLKEHPEAWSVGGPLNHAARGRFGKAVAVAMSHPLGVGNAKHHFRAYEGYVEGAPFPAIRRWVFDRVGYYDEHLVRNQDDEFNFRLRQAGGKVFISPRAACTYFVREKMMQLFKQYFQYGFWRIPVMRKHQQPTTIRQVVPLLFFASVGLLALAGLWFRQPLVAFALPTLYATALCTAALLRCTQIPLAVAWRMPIAMATIHAAYAAGMFYGFLAAKVQPNAWNPHGQMATLSR